MADRKAARVIDRRTRKRAQAALEHAKNRRPGAVDYLRAEVRRRRDAGGTDDQIAREIAAVVDTLIPAGAFGPIGATVELVDGLIAYAIARAILALVRRRSRRLQQPAAQE